MRRATTTIRQGGRKKKLQQYHHNTNRLSSVVNTLINEPNKTVMPNKRSRGQQKSLRIWNFIRYKFLGFAFRLCTRLNGCTHHPPLLPPFLCRHYSMPWDVNHFWIVARFFFFLVAGCAQKGVVLSWGRTLLMLRALDDLLQFVRGSRFACVAIFLVATVHGWWSRLFHLVATTLKAYSGTAFQVRKRFFELLQRGLLVWKPAIKYSYSSRTYQVMTPLSRSRSRYRPVSMLIRVTFVYYA